MKVYSAKFPEDIEKAPARGRKAKGKRLTTFAIDHITELEPIATEDILDEDDAEPGQSSESADQESEDVAEPEKSDDEVRDELTGQHRLF